MAVFVSKNELLDRLLVRFKEESDLPWAELNRCLGAHPQTMRRWKQSLSWLGGNRLD